MRCPSWNHDNPDDTSFCEECGAKLELICPACKASVSPEAQFCKKCPVRDTGRREEARAMLAAIYDGSPRASTPPT
jgi:predicted amidophosphoribosyltransferase